MRVCDRWDSFENFLADMGCRPSPKHSIDRIDNNDDYGPYNCRWATWEEQNRNRRDSVYVEHDGRTWSLQDLADHFGVPGKKLWRRLRDGWPTARALEAAHG